MRLVTFVHDGQPRLGALVAGAAGELVYDLNRLEARLPADMIAFLEGGQETHRLAEAALASADAGDAWPLAAVTLRAPILRPGKII